MKCKRCGIELSENCLDCESEMLSAAIHKATESRRKQSKFIIIPEAEYKKLLEGKHE